jgi:glycerophosphoryl diester phosphodiesterase
METPLIAHRCGRAYGPDSSRRALRAALAGGPLGGVETEVCLTRDGALACLHDAYLPFGTTLTGWAHERSVADVLAGRLLDGEGRATAERPLLVDEVLDLVPPGFTVQLDVKAHADAALARRTVDALAAFLARRPDAGRVEVLSFHAAAVEQAVSAGWPPGSSFGRTTRLSCSRGGPPTSTCAACASNTFCSASRSLRRCATPA